MACRRRFGVDPKIMGIAPAYAVPLAMKRAGLGSPHGRYRMQRSLCRAEFGGDQGTGKPDGREVNMNKWNPNGGAIAFGHPNGASGARICSSL